jgi:hypothetical protein
MVWVNISGGESARGPTDEFPGWGRSKTTYARKVRDTCRMRRTPFVVVTRPTTDRTT